MFCLIKIANPPHARPLGCVVQYAMSPQILMRLLLIKWISDISAMSVWLKLKKISHTCEGGRDHNDWLKEVGSERFLEKLFGFKSEGEIGSFLSPRACIEGERSEFFQVKRPRGKLGIFVSPRKIKKMWRNMKEISRKYEEIWRKYEGIMKDIWRIWRKYEQIWRNMKKIWRNYSPHIWAVGLTRQGGGVTKYEFRGV